MSDNFEVSSKGNAEAFLKRFANIKGAHVKVGFPKGTFDTYKAKGKSSKTMSTLDTAIINEFGAPDANIPARPFIRSTLEVKKKEIQALQTRLAKAIVNGKVKSLKDGLELLGKSMKGWIQYSIKTWTTPGNAESTIARKGEDKPLRELGKMLRSVTYKVEND